MLAAVLSACGGGSGDAAGGAVAADAESAPILPDGGGGAGGVGGTGGTGGSGGVGGHAGGTGGVGGTGPDLGLRFACDDGVDNDGDTFVDLADPGCTSPEDDDESDATPAAQCSDDLDNDADDRLDLADPDCTSESDPSEQGENTPTACANEVDDDADGWVDFPADPGCRAAGDADEADGDAPACFNTQDDDGDGRTDYPEDPGCQGRGDMNEADPATPPVCANGADDDTDGLTDFPADPGCVAAADTDESGACGAGHDTIDLNAWLAEHPAYDGSLEGGTADFAGSCGGGAGPERIFEYRLGERVGALIFRTDHPETDKPTVVYVRSSCVDPLDAACNRGSEASPGTVARIERPAPGLYFVVVDTSSAALGPGDFRLTVETVPAAACDNARDDDADGAVDLADPGCIGADDLDETDTGLTLCSDGLDNDNDGTTDYPADPDCLAAGGQLEGPLCDAALNLVPVAAPGGRYVLPLGVGDSVTNSRCGEGLGVESVLAVSVQDASRITVTVTADDEGEFQVSLRSLCDDIQSEITCDTGYFGDNLRFDQETEGAATLYFFIESGGGEIGQPAGSATATVTVESLITACNDVADNDADGLVDLADPGCERGNDPSEADPPAPPICLDGLDNDADGLIDFPADDGCRAAGDRNEAVACVLADEVDDVPEGGGIIPLNFGGAADIYDLECGGSGTDAVAAFTLDGPAAVLVRTINADFDTVLAVLSTCDNGGTSLDCDDDGGEDAMSELSFARLDAGTYFAFVQAFGGDPGHAELEVIITPDLPPGCNDTLDNDGDGQIDATDPGCAGIFDEDEADPAMPAACSDGADNDADGATDFPLDADCAAAGGETEDARCLDHRAHFEVGQAGGVFAVNVGDGPDLVTLTCDAGGAGELPFALTLTEPSNLHVSVSNADGDSPAVALSLRTGCGEAGAPDEELVCTPVFNGLPLAARNLAPGLYYVFAQDAAGASAGDVTVTFQVDSLQRACNDTIDNDADGLVDAADPGCGFGMDTDEADPALPAECADGLDNDADGQIDYPADEGCRFAGGAVEAARCPGGFPVTEAGPESGVVSVDFADALDVFQNGCTDSEGPDAVIALTLDTLADVDLAVVGDTGETGFAVVARTDCPGGGLTLTCSSTFNDGTARLARVAPGLYYIYVERPLGAADLAADVTVNITPVSRACNDGEDNDEDARVDAADPGCAAALDGDEADPDSPGACGDAVDNDADGLIDFPVDPECAALGAPSEAARCPAGAAVIEVGSEGGVFDANFSDAASLGETSCDPAANYVVYAVTVEELSRISVSADDPGFDALSVAIRSDCVSTTDAACDRSFGQASAMAQVEAGTHFILVGTSPFGAQGAQVTISVESLIRACNDAADNDNDGLLDLLDPGCGGGLDDDETDPAVAPVCADAVDNDDDGLIDYPADRECRAAGGASEALSCDLVEPVAVLDDAGGQVNTDTGNLPDLYNGSSCGAGGEGGENIIGLVLSQPAAVDVIITAGNYDTVMYLRTTCDDLDTELDCNDDSEGLLSALFFPRLEAGQYFIIVDGYSGDSGTATVDVQVTPL